MKKEYVFRYVIEGTVVLDGIHSDAEGQSILRTELACGNIPAQRSLLEILNERTVSQEAAASTTLKEAS